MLATESDRYSLGTKIPQRKLEPSPSTLEKMFSIAALRVNNENRNVNARQTKACTITLSSRSKVVSAATSVGFNRIETTK